MRTILLFSLVLALAAGCGKGVGSYGDAADQGAAAMNEYASILASIKDKSTAEAAKPKLEALAKRMAEIVEGMKSLDGPPDDAEQEKHHESVRTAMQGVSKEVSAFIDRTMDNPEIRPVIADSFGAVSKQLMPLRAMLGV